MSTNTGSASGRRLDGPTRRHQLLRIGCELFGTRPYDEVWIDHVAAHAGISRGLLYHYFGSKRGFLLAVVTHEATMLLTATQPDPNLPPRQQLRTVLDAYLDYVQARPHGYRAIHRGAASTDTQVRAILETNLRHQEQRILTTLTGGGTPPEPLRLAVHGWIAFLIATCLDWLEHPTLDRTSLRELCAQALTSLITASRHPPPNDPT